MGLTVWLGVRLCWGDMATFILQRCKYREGWLVPKKGEQPLQLEWHELCERLAPSGSMRARMMFRQAAPNAFIGLVRQHDGSVTNFVYRNHDLSGDVRALVKANPAFERQLVDVFRVEKVLWEDRMIEVGSPRKTMKSI